MERPYRSPEEIAELISNHHYYENNVGALEHYIMTELTIAEARTFAHFLRGEDWSPCDPEWHRDTSSYIKLTWISHDRLTLFFDRLVRDCYLYMGAASVLKMNGSQLIPAAVETNLNLLNLTLYELTRLVPAEYRKQLDAATRLDDIKGLVEASKAQGDRIEGKVGDLQETANETQTAATATVKFAKNFSAEFERRENEIADIIKTGEEQTKKSLDGVATRLGHLKTTIAQKDYDIEDVRQLQRDTLAAVHELKDGKPAQDETTVPDPRDYRVTTGQLADLLTKLHAGRTARMIQKWEQHLKTDGREGTPPPDGYNLGTRLTIETATAWAQTFASHETEKLSNKIAFDDRFHQRPK